MKTTIKTLRKTAHTSLGKFAALSLWCANSSDTQETLMSVWASSRADGRKHVIIDGGKLIARTDTMTNGCVSRFETEWGTITATLIGDRLFIKRPAKVRVSGEYAHNS